MNQALKILSSIKNGSFTMATHRGVPEAIEEAEEILKHYHKLLENIRQLSDEYNEIKQKILICGRYGCPAFQDVAFGDK
jgi:predicted translin family RNA/ssDNA-binding protein